MRLTNAEKIVKEMGGVFTSTEHGPSLSKMILKFENREGKDRWFLWYDHNSVPVGEARSELLKIFALDINQPDILKISTNGA